MTGETGDHYVKVAPKAILYSRETRAYREAVPHLGYGNAPILRASSAELLALILSAVDGQPMEQEESPARRRTAHRQAGLLLRRLHDAVRSRPGQSAVAEDTVKPAWRSTSWTQVISCPPQKPTRCATW